MLSHHRFVKFDIFELEVYFYSSLPYIRFNWSITFLAMMLTLLIKLERREGLGKGRWPLEDTMVFVTMITYDRVHDLLSLDLIYYYHMIFMKVIVNGYQVCYNNYQWDLLQCVKLDLTNCWKLKQVIKTILLREIFTFLQKKWWICKLESRTFHKLVWLKRANFSHSTCS